MLSLYQKGHALVVQRVRAHPLAELAITVTSIEEQLSGWYAELRRAKQPAKLAAIYERLTRTIQFLKQFRILSLSEAAILQVQDLRALKLNIGTMDLRIAAIVLEHGALLVSRYLRDFRRIPGLSVEDWSVE
jgi:tRNA(fMet)-specific endonuclease VapC